jgi:molybdate transport system ATP-binding protein
MNRIEGRDAAGRPTVLIAAPGDVRLSRGSAAGSEAASAAVEGRDGHHVRAVGVVRRVEASAGRIRVALRLDARDPAPGSPSPGPSLAEGAEVTAELDAAAFAALRPTAGERLHVRIPRDA